MATFTTRLQLEKPATSDQMNIGDLVLSTNYKLIDDNAGAPTFTSGTRPGTPYTGRVIFESDTSHLRFYNGTKWAYLGNTNSARDIIQSNTDTTSSAATSTEILHRSKTFNAVQGRRYRIDWALFGEKSTEVQGRYNIKARWAAGASVANTDTLIASHITRTQGIGTTGKGQRSYFDFPYSAASQQITIGLFAQDSDAQTTNISTNTDTVDVSTYWSIRDWGV